MRSSGDEDLCFFLFFFFPGSVGAGTDIGGQAELRLDRDRG